MRFGNRGFHIPFPGVMVLAWSLYDGGLGVVLSEFDRPPFDLGESKIILCSCGKVDADRPLFTISSLLRNQPFIVFAVALRPNILGDPR